MKRIAFALTALSAVTLAQTFAGPEAISPKESKTVVQPVVETECRWTGFYLGGNAGYAFGGDASFLEVDEFDPRFDFERDGFIGGGQVGFNYQLGRCFVIGVEGTFDGWDGNDHTRIVAPSGEETRGDLGDSEWIATAGGRVGVSLWKNRILAYAKGGIAFTQWDFTTHEVNDIESFRLEDDERSGFVGAGLEYAFNCHWSVRVEWNHIFLDDTGDQVGVETEGTRVDNRTWTVDLDDIDTVVGGINFKF